MKIEPETVIALMLSGAGAVFFFLRWLWRRGDKKVKVQQQKAAKIAKEEKDRALEKFREVHSRARDNRKRLAQEIENDPDRAAKTLRNMLKQ